MFSNRLQESKTKVDKSWEVSDLIQILNSVMSHCSQTISVDFLKFLLERRHLMNLKKSAKKFIKRKKFNLMMKKKWLILTLIYY